MKGNIKKTDSQEFVEFMLGMFDLSPGMIPAEGANAYHPDHPRKGKSTKISVLDGTITVKQLDTPY